MEQVEVGQINERYGRILAEQGICAEIDNVYGDLPTQEIIQCGDKNIIRLNLDKIAQCGYLDYEDVLSFNVSKLILPQLTLESERLIIRRLQLDDAEALFESLNDRESCYLDAGEEPYPEMNENYMELIRGFAEEQTHYVMVQKSTGRVIGSIRMMGRENRQVYYYELGYGVIPSQQRKGYAYEGLSMLTDYLLKELHVDMLVACAIEDNIPSLNLIKKLGFTYEGRIRKGFWYPPKGRVDLLSFYKER